MLELDNFFFFRYEDWKQAFKHDDGIPKGEERELNKLYRLMKKRSSNDKEAKNEDL